MAAATFFTLCGLGISNETQYKNPVTADRMYQSCLNLQKNTANYDPLDIRGAIRTLIVDADGLIQAVQKNCTKNIQGNPLSQKEIRQELSELGQILQTTIQKIENFWNTSAGRVQWGQDVLNSNPHKNDPHRHLQVLSLSKLIQALKERGETLASLA